MALAIILAAGKGTRMRSYLPKPLVSFKEKPIVLHIIEAFEKAGIEEINLIVGYEAPKVISVIEDKANYILQPKQNGTADAVKQAKNHVHWKGQNVFVFVGDAPLITPETIHALELHHIKTGAGCTFLTATFDIDLPYARVIRNDAGVVIGCVEERNANKEQLKIRELLSSHFIFKGDDLFELLDSIEPDPKNDEYYLTDIIQIFLSKGLKVEALSIDHYQELVGLNTPEDLQWAEQFVSSIQPNVL
ncbi:MAG: NTP transferase domain-containing protein [Cytophaga sp.]|uniref:NTP transferase domain-containing protein n=1 Tax=Cytophaga sp. TaxID=29535 RepID=UPI003F7FF658